MADGPSKRDRVREMFGRIAPGYDRLNSVLSLGMHHRWRRFAARQCMLPPGGRALDVGMGTADFAIATIGGDGTALGVDPCAPMLHVGREKLRSLGLESRVRMVVGESEHLPVPDAEFDCATIGFTLRNVTDVDSTFAEMARAVRSGGKVVSLEIVAPEGILRPFFSLYFYHLSPWLAALFGGDRHAYRYLPASVKAFQTRAQLVESMQRAGLVDIRVHDLNGGLVCVHVGTKP
jgi:demethylmenaquinone methyltransferase/2-methoxy-6-polyprenyl-1,4-benzoquinol methylase